MDMLHLGIGKHEDVRLTDWQVSYFYSSFNFITLSRRIELVG